MSAMDFMLSEKSFNVCWRRVCVCVYGGDLKLGSVNRIKRRCGGLRCVGG